MRDELARHRIGDRLAEGVARLESISPSETKGAAMDLVAAGFGLGDHDSGVGLGKLCIRIRGNHFHFTQRIEVRVDYLNAQDHVVIVSAVKLKVRPAKFLAIHFNLDSALRILACRMLPRELRSARLEKLEIGSVAIE